VLFGLIMAVTIVGSLSIATAGQAELRTVLIGALGCNVAWGLVDAVMYVVRTATERARLRDLGRRIRGADAASGEAMIAQALPDHLGMIVGTAELDGMRSRLLNRPADTGPLLRPRAFLEALGIFLMVVVATFPVVVPFLVVDEVTSAMRASQIVTLAMLFLAGAALGRHANYGRPWATGLAMAIFGAVLIAAVKALGG
jgi:VIT1/CCC1 family predicted Fe2+/Mn2+ transporter